MADDYGSDNYAADYQQIENDRQAIDADVKHALEHAEQVGLNADDLKLLAWASGSRFKPKGE